MTIAEPSAKPDQSFDPDEYRMTIGEHLEELRWRMILALVGLVLIVVGCLFFGDRVLMMFCRPLYDTLQAKGLNPQLYYTELGESFMVWIEVNLVVATALASPWIAYQLWQFVATGLYAHERRYVTRYMPLSIGLLIGGMLFVYFLVLPWTIQFFLDFSSSVPVPQREFVDNTPHDPVTLPVLNGNPSHPKPNEIWIDARIGQIKVNFENQGIRVVPFSPQSLLVPHITIADYVDLVIGMLITFGLSFQLPLVVLALVRIGIVEIASLRSLRRYIYFGISILAAAITPGDVITATIALMVPLILLYELGIWLAAWGHKPNLTET